MYVFISDWTFHTMKLVRPTRFYFMSFCKSSFSFAYNYQRLCIIFSNSQPLPSIEMKFDFDTLLDVTLIFFYMGFIDFWCEN